MQRGHRVVVLCTVIVLFSLERCSLEEFPTSCPRGFRETCSFCVDWKKELETPGSSLIPPFIDFSCSTYLISTIRGETPLAFSISNDDKLRQL